MIAVLLSYLPLLAANLALETATVAAIGKRGERRSAVLACIALNLLTHPMATLLVWRWNVDPLALEAFVFLFEWIGFAQLLRIGLFAALRYALLPNVLSALAGFGLWILLLM